MKKTLLLTALLLVTLLLSSCGTQRYTFEPLDDVSRFSSPTLFTDSVLDDRRIGNTLFYIKPDDYDPDCMLVLSAICPSATPVFTLRRVTISTIDGDAILYDSGPLDLPQTHSAPVEAKGGIPAHFWACPNFMLSKAQIPLESGTVINICCTVETIADSETVTKEFCFPYRVTLYYALPQY